MFNLDTSIHIIGHVLVAVCVEDFPYWWYLLYATSLIVPVFMRFSALVTWFQYMSDISSHYGDLDPLYIFSLHGDHDPLYIFILWILIYLYCMWRSPHILSCLFMAIVLLCIRDCYMYLQLYAELYYCTMVIGWLVFHLGSFITPLLGWTYNVFRTSYDPSDLTY